MELRASIIARPFVIICFLSYTQPPLAPSPSSYAIHPICPLILIGAGGHYTGFRRPNLILPAKLARIVRMASERIAKAPKAGVSHVSGLCVTEQILTNGAREPCFLQL